MSRRKQSNPKPFKRKDEADLEELCHSLGVPTDIIQLKEEEDSSLVVVATILLPVGSVFGPFKGEITTGTRENEEEIQGKEWKLPAEDKDTPVRLLLTGPENEGGFLPHILPRQDNSEENVIVTIKENFIWCRIVKPVEPNQKLVAVFTACPTPNKVAVSERAKTPQTPQSQSANQRSPLPQSPKQEMVAVAMDERQSPELSREVKVLVPKTQSPKKLHPLIYMCMYCGVRYSSPSTLEAHQSYYCTKTKGTDETQEEENVEMDEENPRRKRRASSTDGTEAPPIKLPKQENQSPTVPTRVSPVIVRSMTDQRSSRPPSVTSQPSKSPVTPPVDGTYRCSQCTFKSDTESGLQRHLPLHGSPSGQESNNETDSDERTSPGESFCKECQIQFSSADTYKAHKDFYCRMRQNRNQTTEDATLATSITPVDVTKLLSPDGTKILSPGQSIIMPAGFSPGASAVTGSVALTSPTVVLTTPFITPGRGLQNMPAVIMQPVIALPNTVVQNTVQAHQKESQNVSSKQDIQPLDLTVKKRKVDEESEEDGVVNLSQKTSSVLVPNEEQPQDLSKKKTDSPFAASLVKIAPKPHTPSPVESTSAVANVSKPGISRCSECNIVFYRFENFLIHKQFYCSERQKEVLAHLNAFRHGLILDGKDQPGSRRSSSNSDENRTEMSPNQIEQKFLQFYCFPCMIKFSSPDTLRAHKEFYCPHRAQIQNHQSREDDDGETEMEAGIVCGDCGKVFATKRLLQHHICSVQAVSAAMLQCPHCDYIGPSDTRLLEHMKAHEPSKVYKCTLCGYRGNTVRGMRMHGRVHIDNGEEFTDANMLEYEEPPTIPKQSVSNQMKVLSGADVTEEELIRMKNEPYKRRRSRKAYEKVENMDPQSSFRKQAPHVCGICGEKFPDTTRLRFHVRTHEIQTFACRSCEYISNTKCDLVHHVKVTHEASLLVSVENEAANEKEAEDASMNSDKENSVEIVKKEPVTIGYADDETEPNQHSPVAKQHSSESSTHQMSPQSSGEDNPISDSLNESKENNNDTKLNNSNETKMAKKDEMDESVFTEAKIIVNGKLSSSEIHQPLKRPVEPLSPVNKQTGVSDAKLDLIAMKNDKTSARYCQTCDITFLYGSTFMAHKKYYCKAHLGELNETEVETTCK